MTNWDNIIDNIRFLIYYSKRAHISLGNLGPKVRADAA